MYIKVSFVILTTLFYAVIRYIIFGEISWNQLPSFITNKSISWSAVIFLLLAGYNYCNDRKQLSKKWGRLAFHFALIHIIISVGIFSPQYYGKFFSDNLLTLLGEIMILSGSIAIYSFYRIKSQKQIDHQSTSFELLGILFVSLHLLSMGIPGWFEPAQWHGGLPPISLLSYVLVITAGILYVIPKFQKRNEP